MKKNLPITVLVVALIATGAYLTRGATSREEEGFIQEAETTLAVASTTSMVGAPNADTPVSSSTTVAPQATQPAPVTTAPGASIPKIADERVMAQVVRDLDTAVRRSYDPSVSLEQHADEIESLRGKWSAYGVEIETGWANGGRVYYLISAGRERCYEAVEIDGVGGIAESSC